MVKESIYFTGREEELASLRQLVQKKTSSLVVIKGRRRIGKSRLIEEFGSYFDFFYEFAGLFPENGITQEEQLDEFSRELARQFNLPFAKYIDWSDAFWALSERTNTGRTLILLDEISWMGWDDKTFLPKLKSAWDLRFKKNNQLILVLCGSVSSWINDNILASSNFFGRISLALTLEELPLADCKAFWGKQAENISNFEKLKLLAVTGGIPKYLEEIQPSLSAEENIRQLCFVKTGILYNDFANIFTKILQAKSDIYLKIIQFLITKPAGQQEVCDGINVESSGVISDYFEEMVQAGFLKRDFIWDFKTSNISKKSKYRISDNYIRFYLKYILPNKIQIDNDLFQYKSMSSMPGWLSILGLQFENLVLKNRNIIIKAIGLQPDEIVCDGPYYQNKTTRQDGCQIDYLIQTKFDSLYVCEIKFSKNPIGLNVVEEVKTKLSRLKIPKHFSSRAILIHANSVTDEVEDSQFFAKIINVAEMM